MKRITTYIVIAYFSLIITTAIQAEPKVEVQQNSFDFGYAPQDSKLSHKYWIHSTGTEDLKILKVVPGCGCTKTPLEKNIVASGDSTWLEIIFSSKKYKNKITKRPKFFTNAGEDAQRISFSTEIVAPNDITYPLVISPFKVNLSKQKIQNNQHLTKSSQNKSIHENPGTVQITNSSENKLTITIIQLDREKFDVVLPKTIKAGETVSGEIFLNSRKNKTFYKSLTIEVNDENKTRFTIPVVYTSNLTSQK